MRVLLAPLIGLGAVGLVLSLIVHVCALLGIVRPFGAMPFVLGVGVFVVCFPAVLVANHLAKDFKKNDFWRAALRGCPRWMQKMAYGFGAYAVLNWVIMMADVVAGAPVQRALGRPWLLQSYSAMFMAAYSFGLAALYSGVVCSRRDPARRCPNGHPVPPSAVFCEQCGEPVTDDESDEKMSRTT
jgi:hypothetical protein